MIFRSRSFRDFLPFTLYITGALFVFIVAVSGFVALADEVREGEALAIDVRILEMINQISTAWLDRFFTVVTWLGDFLFVTAVSVGLCGVLLKKRAYRSVATVASVMLGAVFISQALKLLFARPRPELWEALVHVSTPSFPSGHAIASSALALTVVYFLWSKAWRLSVVVIGVLYVVLIGFSRLYLGVHYPSDVVAGWLVSTAWFVIVVSTIHLWRVYRDKAVVSYDHE